MGHRGESRHRRGALAIGATCALIGLIVAGVGSLSQPVQAAQAEDPALAKFGEMMPVFTSPRCVNCHGGINPVKGDGHEVGAIDVPVNADGEMGFDEKGVCAECHTAAQGQWRTAPHDLAFVGKDTLALCRQMRSTNSAANFVNHVATDDLIGLAFVGQGGIGPDSAFAPIAPDPPPMTRAEMVAAATRWVDAGAGCGSSWNGSITRTTTRKTHTEQTSNKVVIDGGEDVSVMVAIVDGQGRATLHVTGHDSTDPTPNGGCNFQHNTRTAEGSGAVQVQILGDASGGGFFVTFSEPEGKGTRHREIGTGPSPTCKPVRLSPVPDEPYTVQAGFTAFQIVVDPADPVDPNDPNHLFGYRLVDEMDGGSTTIVWDLTRS